MNKILIIVILAISILSTANSQEEITDTTKTGDTVTIPDSMVTKNLKEFMSKAPEPKTKYVMTKSPTKAILYSLLLPGMGQLYVESYWKVPLFVGGVGGLVYGAIWFNNQYKIEQKLYDDEKIKNPLSSDLSLLSKRKEYFRDNRDQMIFYVSGVYILAAVDAYVGAHLYDFNVSDDLTMSFQPSWNNIVGLKVCLKW